LIHLLIWNGKVHKENNMKYREDEILNEVKEYIEGTYSQHYSTTKDGFQVQDMLRQIGIDKDFCQANAIKYLCRYGKKDGKNRKDLLKAIHYVVLLMSSEDQDYMNEMVMTPEEEDRNAGVIRDSNGNVISEATQ